MKEMGNKMMLNDKKEKTAFIFHLIIAEGFQSDLRPTFFSLRSSIGELAELDVASPSKKHSLVISSWEDREELRWGSTWRSDRNTQVQDTGVNEVKNQMKT